MRVIVNRRDVDIPEKESVSIRELLNFMRYTFPNIVVKLNGLLIKKPDYAETFVKEGDNVDAIHMISGG